MKKCGVCGKLVTDADAEEHLKTNHFGPHYFTFNGKKIKSDAPSMLGYELRKFLNVSNTDHLWKENGANDVLISSDSGMAIDLTNNANLYTLPRIMTGG